MPLPAIPHNKGVWKSPLGPALAYVEVPCASCGRSFRGRVERIESGQSRFCSRRCNPRYAPKSPRKLVVRRANLKANYGLTVEQYEALSAAQDDKCRLCGNHASANRHGLLYVDHDHATGKVRALLCPNCNAAVGLFRDDASLMRAAANYVEEFR